MVGFGTRGGGCLTLSILHWCISSSGGKELLSSKKEETLRSLPEIFIHITFQKLIQLNTIKYLLRSPLAQCQKDFSFTAHYIYSRMWIRQFSL